MRDATQRKGPYHVTHKFTGKVLARHALVTPYLAQQGGGLAVRREGIWYAVNYEGFKLEPGEKKFPVTVLQEASDE